MVEGHVPQGVRVQVPLSALASFAPSLRRKHPQRFRWGCFLVCELQGIDRAISQQKPRSRMRPGFYNALNYLLWGLSAQPEIVEQSPFGMVLFSRDPADGSLSVGVLLQACLLPLP